MELYSLNKWYDLSFVIVDKYNYYNPIHILKYQAESFQKSGYGEIVGKVYKGKNTNTKFQFNSETLGFLELASRIYDTGFDNGSDYYYCGYP